MTDAVVILCNCAGREQALEIGNRLIEERLAGCVNVLAPVESVYRWKGKLETEQEVPLIVKTTQQLFPAVRDRITELHSYDTPEIIALPVVAGSDKYLSWLRAQIS